MTETVINGVVYDRGAHRQEAPRQAFSENHQIRNDPRALTREHGPRSSEAHGNFVGNKKESVVFTETFQALQILFPVEANARRALAERLHDNRRGFMVMFSD